jgi:hypothetical protein
MSLIGKSVYHIHDVNKIQFGNVIDEKIEKVWKWVKVNWTNGHPTNIYNSPTIDVSTDWFRIDTIQFFEPLEMITELKSL